MAEYDPVRKEELRIMGFEQYQRKPSTPIMAKRVTAPTTCNTKHGQVVAQPGQFIVEKPDGEVYPITVEDLGENYFKVEGDVEADYEDDPGPVGFPAEIGIITRVDES